MTKKIKALFHGMGSVLDIAPAPNAQRFVPQGSDAERLRADFVRIGDDMRHVFSTETRHGQTPPASQTTA